MLLILVDDVSIWISSQYILLNVAKTDSILLYNE